MVKAVVTDFSKVLLHAKDPDYHGGLNALNNGQLARDASYPFFEHFVVNVELLKFYQHLGRKLPVYVFTTGTVQDHPAIKAQVHGAFSGVFSANELKLSKTDPSTFAQIAKLIRHEPGDVLYIDDKAVNLEAATSAGMKVALYTSNADIIAKLRALTDSQTY